MTERRSTDFLETLDLLGRAKGGDREALDDLLARYTDRILEIVRIRLGRPLRAVVESRDILQETLVEAFQGFDAYSVREDAQFLSWLSRIAENRVLRRAEYHRAQKRDAGRVLPIGAGDSVAPGVDPPDGGPSAASRLALDEERDAVADCVASLPEKYRVVIAMRDYVGASWEEVARETGHATANAARMTHHRARLALGRLLRERGL